MRNNNCARCAGDDPNCWLCSSEIDKEDDCEYDLDAAYNLSVEDEL